MLVAEKRARRAKRSCHRAAPLDTHPSLCSCCQGKVGTCEIWHEHVHQSSPAIDWLTELWFYETHSTQNRLFLKCFPKPIYIALKSKFGSRANYAPESAWGSSLAIRVLLQSKNGVRTQILFMTVLQYDSVTCSPVHQTSVDNLHDDYPLRAVH